MNYSFQSILRGLKFYHQRTAIQADVEHLEALCRASAKVQ